MKQTGRDWALLSANKCSLKALDVAISELVHLLPKHKEQLLIACVACVTADGRVSVKEAELLRVITELLECPLPPLLPTQG
jgi:hypothetical protein